MTTKRTSRNKAGEQKKRKKKKDPPSEKKHFSQLIFDDWCKACGICIAFCPQNVFGRDRNGKPVAERPDDCNSCLFCELHCPDFAITIEEKTAGRKKTDGNR